MENDQAGAEIIVYGIVQGVGFRNFVFMNARRLGVKGFTQNLMSGEVYTVAEGSKFAIEELFNKLKIGPFSAHVTDAKINWKQPQNKFNSFEIKT